MKQEDKSKPDEARPQLRVVEVPEGLRVVRADSIPPSQYVKSLSYRTLVEQSDLVAVVEITGPILSYSDGDHIPFTLYTGTVIHCLKGSMPQGPINVRHMGGYDPRWKTLVFLLYEPHLKKGDAWLFFLTRQTWEPNLKTALPNLTYRAHSWVSLRYVEGRILMPEDFPKWLPDALKIDPMTVEKFKEAFVES